MGISLHNQTLKRLEREGRIKDAGPVIAEDRYFEFRFAFGVPPSVNHYLKRTRDGKVIKTKRARDYQAKLGEMAKAAGVKLAAGRIAVRLLFWVNAGELDIDNGLKCLFDALNGIAWKDDDQIASLLVSKESRGDQSPLVEIQIQRCPEFKRESR